MHNISIIDDFQIKFYIVGKLFQLVRISTFDHTPGLSRYCHGRASWSL